MTAATARAGQTTRRSRVGIRTEIQALRAVAVLAVVVYHVWPDALPGGFVGVDVFFVVSGFLITQHIVQEVARTGRLSVVAFWARRARRLLPAAFTVLLAALVIMLVVIPATRWQQTLLELAASAAYVENWALAAASVDYLAAENAPSVVQHYWSLSVEEQFYLLWPLLIVALLALAAALRRRGASVSVEGMLAAGLGVVALASFVHSVALTASAPGIAYFATSTRAWEFAAGGLLALLGGRWDPAAHPRASAALSWLGFALIALSTVVITGATPFPGAAAALPVVGTLLVIEAGRSAAAWSPAPALEVRPIQWLGDVSYSVYLWHWPLVVAYPFVRGAAPGVLGGVALIAVTLALAAVTKRWVEDPLRRGDSIIGPPRRAITFAVVGAMLFGAIAAGGSAALARQAADAEAGAVAVAECLGARSLSDDADAACLAALAEQAVVPTLAGRPEDTADQYDCYVPEGGAFRTCRFGDENATVRLALRGDSHAASLLTGLREVVERRGWLLDTYYGFGCGLAPGVTACAVSEEFDTALRDGDYDLVLATGTRRWQPGAQELADHWRALMDDGVTVLPVVDVPSFPVETDACVERSGGDREALASCRTTLQAALEALPDRYGDAAELLGIPAVDFTDLFCDRDCPAVIGGVLVYRDAPASHLTASFSATMSDDWERVLAPLVSEEP